MISVRSCGINNGAMLIDFADFNFAKVQRVFLEKYSQFCALKFVK